MIYPLTLGIPYQNPADVFARFARKTGSVFLDSAQLKEGCGRYSIIGVDPFLIMKSKNGFIQLGEETIFENPFSFLKKQLDLYPLKLHSDSMPFQGGLMGFFSYDLCQQIEKIQLPADEIQFDDLVLGYYDVVIGFDQLLKKSWIFSSGYPEQDVHLRKQRATLRLNNFLKIISAETEVSFEEFSCEEITSNFTSETYQVAVGKVIDYILAGDVFEASISQQFKARLQKSASSFSLYKRLRTLNPAPFAAYLNFSEQIIASASPERFLKLTEQSVEARPIKGTCARGKSPEEDKMLSLQLLKSSKDIAENIMIVDLLRNDLSRVCLDHSVKVPQLCELETYATVHHLVSVVTGELKSSLDSIDLLRASFPGGSITGAPKIRAMEIISEIESARRGPYCGSVGYIGFNGDMDLSITIRTFAIKKDIITFQVGGAVTADSNSKAEYEETLTKAQALFNALASEI